MKTIVLILFLILNALQLSYSQHNVINKLEYTTNIKIVWEVSTDNMEKGIGAGLLYPEKQFQRYELLGVTQENRKVSVVVHGIAGKFLLTDEAYKKYTKEAEPNPNKEQVAKLISQGISVELCVVTMQANQWTENDLLPDVTILEVGAYPRLVDLQNQGYRYIKF